MNKRPTSQNARRGGTARRTAPEGTAAQSPPKTDATPSASAAQPAEMSAGLEKALPPGGKTYQNDVANLDKDVQGLVSKMLTEGSTFEDVVETVNERGGDGITLNAVQNYFQGNLDIQARRVRHLIKSADALLATVNKNPRSAEAQLARATFLTGYLRVRRDAALITPKDAERSRMERENLSLKRRILVMQKDKVVQELKYSHARTHLLTLSQEKLKEEIAKLQQEAKGQGAGEPIGPEMLQRIQQLYGLACQPVLGEESGNAATKA